MLKPAQLYVEELQRKYVETWYDPKYIFYHPSTDNCQLYIPDNSGSSCQFACIDQDNNVVGFFSYKIDWKAHNVYDLGLISFTDFNTTLVRDVIHHIEDLVANHNISRLEWRSFSDNPATRGYTKLVSRYHGNKVGTLHQVEMLRDGNIHDLDIYEILITTYSEDYIGSYRRYRINEL